MPPTTQFTTAEFTHIGQRDENQDRCRTFYDPQRGTLLVLVADGMGGHADGALAAQTVVDCVSSLWEARDPLVAAEIFLQQLIAESHVAVNRAAEEIGPRATVAALLLQVQAEGGLQGTSIHAGDCRISQYNAAGELVKMSVDHSLAQLHVLRGKITQEQVATHPDQTRVLECVGGEEVPHAELNHWDINEGARFVVCSDGFWEIFTTPQVARLFRTKLGRQPGLNNAALGKAVATAFNKKLSRLHRHDNTTAILIDAGREKASGSRWSWGLKSLLPLLVVLLTTALWAAEPQPVPPPEAQLPATSEADREAKSGGTGAADVAGDVGVVAQTSEADESGEADAAARTSDTNETEQVTQASEANESGESSESDKTDSTSQVSETNATGQVGETDETSTASQTNESGDATQGQAGTADNTTTNPDQSAPTPAELPLQDLNIATQLEVQDDNDLLSKVSDLLREQGRLGDADSLVLARTGTIGDHRVIRLQQTHAGVPVLAGQVIAIERDGVTSQLTGKTTADIDLEVTPTLTFADAVTALAERMTEPLQTTDTGQLVIFTHNSQYHLAWQGTVTVANVVEELVIDAHDATLLSRYPTLRH